jgi:hypothetical protein
MHILGVKPYAASKDMYVNGIPEEVGCGSTKTD